MINDIIITSRGCIGPRVRPYLGPIYGTTGVQGPPGTWGSLGTTGTSGAIGVIAKSIGIIGCSGVVGPLPIIGKGKAK